MRYFRFRSTRGIPLVLFLLVLTIKVDIRKNVIKGRRRSRSIKINRV